MVTTTKLWPHNVSHLGVHIGQRSSQRFHQQHQPRNCRPTTLRDLTLTLRDLILPQRPALYVHTNQQPITHTRTRPPDPPTYRQGNQLPFYGSQFHAEKNAFEWDQAWCSAMPARDVDEIHSPRGVQVRLGHIPSPLDRHPSGVVVMDSLARWPTHLVRVVMLPSWARRCSTWLISLCRKRENARTDGWGMRRGCDSVTSAT